jgi:hypothetical protein
MQSGVKFMPHRILCVLLAGLLAYPDAWARQTSVNQALAAKSAIQSLGADRLVEVRLLDGHKLRGWIGAISENSFDLRLGQARLESQSIGFAGVRSVKPVSSLKPSHTGRNILIGVAIAVGAIAIGIIVAAKKVGYL